MLELIKRGHIRVKYALLWFLVLLGVTTISFSGSLINQIAGFMGIKYAPTFILVLAILGLLLLNLMLSVIVSHHSDKIIALVQEVALLKNKEE